MLRTAPILLGLLLALPARAEEPPSDEPMPQAQPAKSAQPAAAAPAPAAAAPAPAAAAPAPAAAAPAASTPGAVTKVNADGSIDEVIPNPPKVYALAVGGAAVGSLALSAILGGVALSRSSEQEGNTSSPPLYTRDLRDSGDQGRAMATTSYVFLGVGVALAITDVVLWYETYRKPRVIRRTAEGNLAGGGK
jgi:hypothetical protein